MWCNWSISEYTHTALFGAIFHIRVALTFTCESHFHSHVNHTFLHMRVTLFESEEEAGVNTLRPKMTIKDRELHTPSMSVLRMLQLFDAPKGLHAWWLAMWCNWSISEYTHGTIRSYLSYTSRAYFHMRVTLSSTCESHFPSHASQSFWKWRGDWCESEEKAFVRVRRKLVDLRLPTGYYSDSERNAGM